MDNNAMRVAYNIWYSTVVAATQFSPRLVIKSKGPLLMANKKSRYPKYMLTQAAAAANCSAQNVGHVMEIVWQELFMPIKSFTICPDHAYEVDSLWLEIWMHYLVTADGLGKGIVVIHTYDTFMRGKKIMT